MLDFSFNIDRKMHDKLPERCWKFFHQQLSPHKHLEIELAKMNYLIGLTINLNFTGQDHAGPYFRFRVWGYELYIHFYDNRHWNPKTNDWYTNDCTEHCYDRKTEEGKTEDA